MDALMRAELLHRTGMALPRSFIEIATKFAERGGNIAQGLELFEDTVDMRLCHCIDDRYETMPIEFFPILDTGGDGECFGYVVHAPELQLDDYPMASMVPGENNGVISAGDTTPIALENMIARMRGRPEGFDDVDLVWLATIGLRPDRASASRLIGNEWVRPSPQVPDGWSHLMTSDGVGVVARASQFDPNGTEPLPRGASLARYIAGAEAATIAGHCGSALYYLKEGWWAHWSPDYGDELRQVKDRMLRAYAALGKTLLADSMARYYLWLA